MDQNSVDALLAQIQTDADTIKDNVAGADASTAKDLASVAAQAVNVGDNAVNYAETANGSDHPDGTLTEHPAEVHRLLAIEVPVIVQLGMRRMTVGEVMRLAVGAIIEFNKSADEELELLANNKVVGKGNAVKVGENFGIKITAMGPIRETIRKLGAA